MLHGFSWRRCYGWATAAAAIAFPLLRLFPLNGQFQVDWYNHTWLAAYAGEYLRQRGTAPIVLNTTAYGGMPVPIFYGTLCYPLIGLLTTWINPAVAIRLVALFLTWLQFHLVSRALVRVDVPAWQARAIACLVIWAVYPMTNLYSRSAIPEYIATGLLTCAVASWFLLVNAERRKDRIRIGLGFGLAFVLAAGSHPITALYSLPILALLLVTAYQEHGRDAAFWRSLLQSLALPVALVAVVLAPWLYAVSTFNRYLHIHLEDAPGVWFDPGGIDRWTTRFFPLPHDARMDGGYLPAALTPYLDAQANVPLLILIAGWLAVACWRQRPAGRGALQSLAVAGIAFAFFTWISLSPLAFELLPSFTALIQFAYRAITYQNLALLLAVFALAGALRRHGRLASRGAPLAWLFLGCLVIAGTGVVIKWRHASAAMAVGGNAGLRTTASERRRWNALPPQYYGAAAYATPALFRQFSASDGEIELELPIPVGGGARFGRMEPARVNLDHPTWVRTSIQAFPWNQLKLDGVVVPLDQVRAAGFQLIVRVPAGSHTLAMRSAPDPLWLVLRAVSFAVLGLWILLVLALTLLAWSRPRPAAIRDAPQMV